MRNASAMLGSGNTQRVDTVNPVQGRQLCQQRKVITPYSCVASVGSERARNEHDNYEQVAS